MKVDLLRELREERAAREKAEQERDEAVERADIAEAKWCGIEARLREVDGELEQTRVQLAGCGVAAYGGTKDPAKCGDYGWSDSYQATLDLRLKHDALEARLRAVIEALRQISEPDQGPLSAALATGDHMRIIQAVTHALNTGRDIARAALRDASPEPEASKQAGGTAFCIDLGAVIRGEAKLADHAFHWGPDNEATHCALPGCGRPWSQHGGRR